jgi:hypothetical protein
MSHRSAPLRFLVAILLCLGSAPAIAQDATAEITIKINPSDLDVLSRALDALPLSETAGPIIKIQAQIDAQPGHEWDRYRSARTVEEIGHPARGVKP